MSGLLGDSFDDPASQANYALAAGLLSPGSFGQGLGKGLAGYQGTLSAIQERQLKQQQIAQAIQDQKIKEIQLQQQTRMFNLQTPFLEEAVKRMQGGGGDPSGQPVPGMAAPMPAAPGGPPGMGQPAQGAPMPQQGAPQQPAPIPQRGSMFPGVPDNVAYATIGTGGFNKIPDLISKFNEPTELIKSMNAAGIDPASPLGRQLIQANIAKSNYVAPLNVRPGGTVYNAQMGRPEFAAPDSRGTQITYGPNGATMGMVPGAVEAEEAAARAKTAGEGSVLPYGGVSAAGAPLPLTNRTAAATGSIAPTPNADGHPVISTDAGLQGIREALPLMIAERDKMPPGPNKDMASREINRNQNALLTGKPWSATTSASAAPAGGIYAAAPLGAETGAKNAQDTMNGSFKNVMAANTSSQTVQARLSNINQLANSAITGGETEYRDAANNLLSLAFPGDVGKLATDRKTAGDLIDKNAAQIALAIGAGSNGTDALRSLAAAANPGRHMTPQAITEAVAQLQGSAQIQQAKAALLTPLYSGGDPASYIKAEQAFDKNADYRIFQLKNMTSQQGAVYLSKLPKADQDELRAKATALKGMGVF